MLYKEKMKRRKPKLLFGKCESMIKIVVGGQLDKPRIKKIISEYAGDKAVVEVQGDLDAAMAMQAGQYDYYIGACNTGSGGALAMAIAILGMEKCVTLSMPGKILSDEKMKEEIESGKIAFGFTAQDADNVLSVILPLIIK
jgi:fructose-1,6-bisphosphatase/sedoheptulose 1,7-bisphosphatase-like protein